MTQLLQHRAVKPKRCSAVVWCWLVSRAQSCLQFTYSLGCLYLHPLSSQWLHWGLQGICRAPLREDVQHHVGDHSFKHCCSLVCIVVALCLHVSCILLCLHASWVVIACILPGGCVRLAYVSLFHGGWQSIDRPPPFQLGVSHIMAPVGVLRYVTVPVTLCLVHQQLFFQAPRTRVPA